MLAAAHHHDPATMVAAAAQSTSVSVPSSSSTPATTTTRKSRPLRRKTSHSVIERRRREKINEGLITLQHTVPACRDELRALLLSKAQSNKRNARRPPSEVEAEVEATLREKVDTQMVLEKLCIISHTVDHVEELQQKLAAYRRLCRCSPPLDANLVAAHGDTHSKVHAEAVVGGDDKEEEEEDASSCSSRSSPPSDNAAQATRKRHASFSELSPDALGLAVASQCTECIIGRAKRQRHWGSNNPLELSKALPSLATPMPAHRHKRSASLNQHANGPAADITPPAPRRQSARKASEAMLAHLGTVRKSSTSSTEALEDVKSIAGSCTLPTLAQDDSEDGGDDSDSELALDDWHEVTRLPMSAKNDARAPPHDHHHQHIHVSRHRHLDHPTLRLPLLRLGPKQEDKRHPVVQPPAHHLPSARPDLLYTSDDRPS